MTEIDRLGWAAGTSFVSHGARIGIRVTDSAVLEQLADHLPPGWMPSSSSTVDQLYSVVLGDNKPGAKVRHYNLLYAGAARLTRTMDREELFDFLESDLHFSVAVNARRRLFVQAGVVGWRGRAIVIPGRSLTGKTSLVTALVRAGATYYSDEYAVFDGRGRVHPYPKPLSLRDGHGRRPTKLPVELLGSDTGTSPLPVGLVLLTEYEPAARWRPRVLTPGQAMLALFDNTVLARIRPEFALEILRRAVPDATTLKGKRGEAEEMTASVFARLEEAARVDMAQRKAGRRR